MRRHLLVAAAAITTTLAVALAVPAFASHETPQTIRLPAEFPGSSVFCTGPSGLGFSHLDVIEFAADDQPMVIEDIEDLFDPADHDRPIVAVIVTGDRASNVYDEPPFHDLVAPDEKTISKVEICGQEEPTEVPTGVPAGVDDGGNGSAGVLGLIFAAGAAAAVGVVVFARRRFFHDS